MASKTITTTEYIDDLDGGKAEGTVTFAYNGSTYEIDLSKKNKTAMEKLLKPYLDSARKVRATRGRAKTTAGRPGKRTDLADIRAWAKAQGLTVSDRGRVAADVIAKYDADH